MRRNGLASMALIGAVFLAIPAIADEMKAPEPEGMRQPPVQPHVAEPRLSPSDLSSMQQTESYRSSLVGSIQQLERQQSSDRDVQDRLQQLRSELSRVQNRLIDANRRR